MESKISKFLMLFAVTIGMGLSVTSCKDTAEDLYNELRNEIWGDTTTTGQGLKDQVAALETLLKNLQAQVNAINSCECDMDAVNARLTQLQTELATKADKADLNNKADKAEIEGLKTEINTLRTYIANTYVAQETYNTAIKNLQDQIDAIQKCTCDPTIPGRLSAAEQAIIDAKALAQQALTAAETAKTAADQAKTDAANAATAAQNAQNTANDAKTAAATAKTAADAANTLANAANTLAKANEQAIETINQTIILIKDRIATMGDSLKVAYDSAMVAAARSYADSIRIDELEKRVSDFETETRTELQNLKQEIADVRQLAMDNLAEAKEFAKQEADKVREELGEAVDDINTRINDLINNYKAVDRALQAQIDDLDERMGAVEKALNDIDARLNKIEDLLRHFVTGVIVQGSVNPAFGTLRLPLGINSHMLVAYYGDAKNDVYFPTSRTGNYVRPEQALTAKDMEVLGLSDDVLFAAGTTLIGEEGANAGKLYLTVNPANVDFQGLNLSLVNSQDEESHIKLGVMKKSDEVLKMGYTRAANNGFYEVPAYVNADDIENVQKVNFNATAVKNAVNEILKKRTGADFKGIAEDMYNLVTDMSLDATAVKVTRKTDAGGDSAVYSTYSIAATAVKPLSLESYKDLNKVTVPGYERVMAFIDRIAGNVQGRINDNKIFKSIAQLQESGNKIELRHVDIINVDELAKTLDLQIEVKIDTTINVKGKTLYLKEALNNKLTYVNPVTGDTEYITFEGNPSITVEDQSVRILLTRTFDMEDMYRSIMGNINTEIKELDKMVFTLTDFLADVNTVIEDALNLKNDVVDGIDNFASRIKNVVDRINNVIVKNVNNINLRFQPIMAVNINGATQFMSLAKNAPTVVNGTSVTLMPTTWNLELLVPLCKKHVAVTNVFKGDASAQVEGGELLSALQAANEQAQMNEVIDGNQREIKLSGLKSGYTYEIAYSALDFYGKIATKKSYITVQ